MKKIRLGSRTSKLAMWQSELAAGKLRDNDAEVDDDDAMQRQIDAMERKLAIMEKQEKLAALQDPAVACTSGSSPQND